MACLMIYGATGYTASLACQYAKKINLDFLVAGRGEKKIKDLASALDVPYRVFNVDDSQLICSAMRDVRVLLNCAGPFAHTAEPLINACIHSGVHYLDTAAELCSYQLAEELDDRAKAANVMLLPGCGGSVAMLGCLAGRIAERVGSPFSIDLALHIAGPLSRGSTISAAEGLTTQCVQRLEGKLVQQNGHSVGQFDFGDGAGLVPCFPVSLPDLITIWRSMKVDTIRTFVHVSDGVFLTENPDSLRDGPTAEQREANPYHAAIVVTAAEGTRRAVLHTVNGYSFTSTASIEAARRVLTGEAEGGFQMPAVVFGSSFAETIAGSVIKYVDTEVI